MSIDGEESVKPQSEPPQKLEGGNFTLVSLEQVLSAPTFDERVLARGYIVEYGSDRASRDPGHYYLDRLVALATEAGDKEFLRFHGDKQKAYEKRCRKPKPRNQGFG